MACHGSAAEADGVRTSSVDASAAYDSFSGRPRGVDASVAFAATTERMNWRRPEE